MRPRLPRATSDPATAPAALFDLSRTDLDLLAIARCPRCRAPLIARMDRRGPYFFCLCANQRSPSPEARG